MSGRFQPAVFGLLAAFGVLICVALVDFREAVSARDDRIRSWLSTSAPALEEALHTRLHLAWGLEAFVRTTPGFSTVAFTDFADALEARWEGVRSLQLAPNGVITHVTQPGANSSVFGLDLLSDPVSGAAARASIEAGEYRIVGPYELERGDTVVAGHMPIYLPSGVSGQNEFWGFAVIVLDLVTLLESSGILDEQGEFEIALRGVDGLVEGGGVFFGKASIFDTSTLREEVHLPHGSWIVAAEALDYLPGYWGGRYYLLSIGMVLAIAAGLVVFMLLRWPQQLRLAAKSTALALDKSRQHYRDLADVAPTGIYHTDSLGNVIFANDRFRQITDLCDELITEDDWAARLHPDDTERSIAEWDEAVLTGASTCEYRIVHRDGSVVWVLDKAIKTAEDDSGNATEFIGTLTDITALKEAQQQIEEARQQADSANAAKSEFLASISHEIRTPLNGILGMVRVMLRRAQSTETKSQLAIVEHSANTLLELLSEVLDLSQIEMRRIEIFQEPLCADRLVREIGDLWTPKAGEKGLRLDVDVVGDFAEARLGDIKRLRQVLSNLLSNAIKFTDKGTIGLRLGLHADAEGADLLEFTVSDTGAGISAADQRVIFDKFTQADGAARRRTDGAGLGLAICKQLVELMGGRIAVDSVEGRGTSFTFTVPCPVTAEQPVLRGLTSETGSEPSSADQLRILVAEDNLINQQVITAMLDQPGFRVDLVDNGKDAVERVGREDYDVVLMDIRMPEMDGVEATRKIRAMGGTRAAVPIIALTANTVDRGHAEYDEAGLSGCVTKPIEWQALLDAISRHASAGQNTAAAKIQVSETA